MDKSLPFQITSELTECETLSLEYMDLVNIPPDGLAALASGLTQSLLLGSNGIKNLPPNAFKSLSQIHTLALDHNEIEEVSSFIWIGLDNLTELNLAANFLSVLSPGSFTTLPKLQSLFLDGNLIDSIAKGAMADLPPSLTYLGLSDNLFYEIPHEFLVFGYPSQEVCNRSDLTISLNLNPLQCTTELCVVEDPLLHITVQLPIYCMPNWNTSIEEYMSVFCNK